MQRSWPFQNNNAKIINVNVNKNNYTLQIKKISFCYASDSLKCQGLKLNGIVQLAF